MNRRALLVCLLLLLLVPVVSVAQTRPPRKPPDATTAPVEKKIPATGDEPNITTFGVVRGNQYAGRCGATIAFEGRDLVPGKFEAHLGSTPLTLTKEATNRMEARLPAEDTGPAKLSVRHVRGKSLLLRDDFVVYCQPKITSVSPRDLHMNETITVRGVGLLDVIQAGGWSQARSPSSAFPDEMQNIVLIGDKMVAINATSGNTGARIAPEVNQNGTEMKVLIRDLWVYSMKPDQPSSGPYYLTSADCRALPRDRRGSDCAKLPEKVSGPIKFASKGQPGLMNTDKFDVVGPSVTFNTGEKPAGALSITSVSASENWSGASVKFMIMVPTLAAAKRYTERIVPRGLQNLIYVEGTGFKDPDFRLGETPLRRSSVTETRAVLELPDNAVTGKVCATVAGKTTCATEDFVVIGPPTVRTLADAPWDVGARVTLEGYDLKSTAVSGLVYEFRIVQDPNDVRMCKTDARLLSHTARQLAFQFGDAATAVPASCARSYSFQSPPRGGSVDRQTANSWQLVATYNGQTKILLGDLFYLKMPAAGPR